MNRSPLSLAVLASVCLLPNANATIEFIYTIKEQVFNQQGNTQPVTPTDWNFGAGASGDDQLTAVSITLPGGGDPVAIVGDQGSFDLDPDGFQSQAALDAAYPNGNVELSVTNGGATENLGSFSITGDAYPIAPHITNALELQAHDDYSLDFELTWNPFTGAVAADRVIIQVWDNQNDEELIFEFLDSTATSYTIPGGTISEDNSYDIEIIFVKETDGLVSPETIIGYLSTTSYYLTTHTSDTSLRFYKWQRNQQTATDQVQVDSYLALATIEGETRTVTSGEITSPAATYTLTETPPNSNSFLRFTEFNTKAELDAAYPSGEYRFFAIEDNFGTDYGSYILPGDAYPTAPQFQNFNELVNFDATQEQSITWPAAPAGVSFTQVIILDQANDQVWSEVHVFGPTSKQLPANTLIQDTNYKLIVRFWEPAVTNDKPPTTLGYITSTVMDFQTSGGGGGGGDPGIDFAYTIKEKSYQQNDNAAPTGPFEWSFGAGVQGGSNVTGGSLDHPGGTLIFTGSLGEYDTGDLEYASQAELDAAFPNGSYTLNITVDGSGQALGPFNISGDS